jgi:glutathione S-transferase/RNA polymerase-associated protein
MLTLYEHPLSPYAQKCKIALREKNVPFELVLPAGIGSGRADAAFENASPRGEVPALVDGDLSIFDSTIILEYIEDRWPQPPLLPKAPAERARVRMIEDVVDTHYEAVNWGLGEVHFFRRGEGKVAEGLIARAAEQIRGFHDWLDRQLGAREWFNGDAFGWGDLCVVPYVNGSAGFGHTPPAGSALAAWLARANARPSVATTAAEARASIAGMQAVNRVVEQGLFKREYRDHRLEWMIKSGGIEVVLDGLRKQNIRFIADFH